MAYVYNIYHWDEGMDGAAIIAALSNTFLKLDQTTPQTVTNGLPLFQDGIKIGYSNWELKPIDINTLGLYINGTLAQSWTVAYVAPDLTGVPYGLLLVLTQPA